MLEIRIMENMKSNYEKHERKIKAPEVREKRVLNTRSILEEALEDDFFEDEDEEIENIDSDEFNNLND